MPTNWFDSHAPSAPDVQAVTGAHPEARISAADPSAVEALPPNIEAVTLGDIKANPVEAMARIGASLKKDVTDPKLWLAVAASYFGPKIFNSAAPLIARAAAKGTGEFLAGAAKNPGVQDLATLVSPRAGAAMRTAGRLGRAVSGLMTTPEAVLEAPIAAPRAPGGAPPVVAEPMAPAPGPAVLSRPTGVPAIKPKLTLDEFKAAEQLIKQGYKPDDVLNAIVKNKMPTSWLNLPSDEEMARAVAHRNSHAAWPIEEP